MINLNFITFKLNMSRIVTEREEQKSNKTMITNVEASRLKVKGTGERRIMKEADGQHSNSEYDSLLAKKPATRRRRGISPIQNNGKEQTVSECGESEGAGRD